MKPTTLREALKSKLNKSELNSLKASYDIIGDLLIIEIPKNLKKKQGIIGKTLLNMHKNIKTVCKRAGIHKGVFRTQKLEIIAGKKNKITTILAQPENYNEIVNEVLDQALSFDSIILLSTNLMPKEVSYIAAENPSGKKVVLIDGAFDRRSYASPLISQATILSTGASVSRDMQEVIQITNHAFNLLTLESEENVRIIQKANEIINKAKVGIIKSDYSINKLNIITALDSVEDILTHLDVNS